MDERTTESATRAADSETERAAPDDAGRTGPVGDDAARRSRVAEGMAIAYWAALDPDRPALVFTGGGRGRRTYGELNRRANQLVRALRRRGLRSGDGVALLCSNRPEFVEVYAACLRAGWRLTPINIHLTTDEVGYILGDCGALAFVADATVAPVVAPAGCASLAVAGALDGFDSYEDALAAEDSSDIDDPRPGTSMLYTSGTTGRPKGVERRAVSLAGDNVSGYRAGHAHLCTGPLYHAAPFQISLHDPVSNGATVVVMDRWDARVALAAIEEHRVSHTHMVPIMFHRLLALPDAERDAADVSSLRLVVHGAAPCPVAVKRAMIDWFGPVLVEYYAATEGAGTLVLADAWLERPGTVGRPVDGQVIVGDEDARPLPAGQTGMVWLKAAPGDERFRYHGDDAKTASAYRGDYFTLGDIGYLDDDGYLFLTDRSANVIISGGVNIYPAEVDAVLLGHPAVADVAVIGVPDPEWGERVLAVVEPRAGRIADDELAAELLAFCRQRLAHFKCPTAVDFVEELPRQDNGKIYKRRLRDRYREDPS